jgi:MFS family permease
MLQSAALAAFALTHTMTVWHLIALGAVQGVINAFDMPARQSFLRQMIADQADLPNAIALNSSMVNGARMIGPVIAAALVGLWGEGICFTIDAASYLAVIGSLLAMKVQPRALPARSSHVLSELAEGLRYVWRFPLIRAVLLLLASSSVLGGSYATLMPVIADRVMGGGAHTLGILLGSAGCGALCAALYLASRTSVVGLATVIMRCAMGLGACMVGMELARSMAVAVPLMFGIGMCMMMQLSATNTMIQSIVDDKMLGRVISLYAVAFFGGAPIGGLLQGSFADLIGPIHMFAVAGALCMLCGLVFAAALPELRRISRPHYIRLGLIKEPPAK